MSIKVGKPPVSLTVTAAVKAEQVVLRGGGLTATLPLHALSALQGETVVLQNGVSLGVVRASDETAQAAVLIGSVAGKPALLWTGRLDLHGDPGERSADALELQDRDGDGHPEIVVGTYDERIRRCGQPRTLLAPRALRPDDGTLKPVLLQRRDAKEAALETLTAKTTSPGPTAPPLLPALRAISASSTLANSDAHALSDGNASTSWVDGVGLGGRFEFVTLRWEAPEQPVRAFALQLGEGSAQIQALSLANERGERLDVTLPADAKPGTRLWITPKVPFGGACFTLAIESVAGATPAAHAALAELEAYTQYDFEGGAAALVAALASDTPQGAVAADLIVHAGIDVAGALIEAWPKLHTQGKRRALRVAAPHLASDARALSIVELGLADPDTEVQSAALQLALGAWPKTTAMLRTAVSSPTPAGDRAAAALAQRIKVDALPLLVAALAAQGGSDRLALREGIADAVERTPDTANLPDLVPGDRPVAVLAALALAISGTPSRQADAAKLILASYANAKEFADRWRLVAAAGPLPANAEIDTWLAQLSAGAKEWMLRAAALEALAAHDPARAQVAARAAADDEYPRVRSAALGVLANAEGGFELLAKASRKDKWFLVRVRALDVLPARPEAQPLLIGSLEDPASASRAAAIRALRRQHLTSAWPEIQKRVEKTDEFPDVIAEGIAFAKAGCVQAAAPTLRAVVTRGLQPEAWSPDQELALSALEALVALGGEQARWANDEARSPLVPDPVRSAIQTRTAANAPCQPE